MSIGTDVTEELAPIGVLAIIAWAGYQLWQKNCFHLGPIANIGGGCVGSLSSGQIGSANATYGPTAAILPIETPVPYNYGGNGAGDIPPPPFKDGSAGGSGGTADGTGMTNGWPWNLTVPWGPVVFA